MTIRKATKRDWRSIKKLIAQYPDKLMQQHLPRPTNFFVAIIDRDVVGCIALDVYSKRLAEIRSLAVSTNHQKKGIATALIALAMETAKKKRIVEVLTITGTPDFFKKFGFEMFQTEKYALLQVLR